MDTTEPTFTLIGRDRAASMTIKIWAHLWLQEIALGLRPESDRQQVADGLKIATEMEIWCRDYRNKQAMAEMEFNDRGLPLVGPHAVKAHTSTSGANDGP